MYPTRYIRAKSLHEATEHFNAHEEAAYLAGGHTLIPTMKSRLASADCLIDLKGVQDLQGLSLEGGVLSVGAATTHADVASSAAVREAFPALAGLAGSIGDVQVRHMGTIGGSLANNDPAADYPAAVLGGGARVVTDRRTLAAEAFFDGLYTTALEEGEIILRVAFPLPALASYAKLRNPASRYALAAAFVARLADGTVRVAITGAGGDGVFRWQEAEAALAEAFEPEAVSALMPDAERMMEDMHASRDYRADLVRVLTCRAVANPGKALIF